MINAKLMAAVPRLQQFVQGQHGNRNALPRKIQYPVSALQPGNKLPRQVRIAKLYFPD